MKKVLVYGLKNMWGGLEKYLLTMHEQIQEDVSFVYLVEQCDCIHQEQIDRFGGEIIYMPPKHPLKENLRQLRAVLKTQRENIDTFYVNINSITFDIAVVLLGLFYRYRVIVHSHNAGMEHIRHPMIRVLHKVLEFISIGLMKMLKITRLAVSDRAADYLFPGSEYDVVVPGIDVKAFAYDPDERIAIRNRLDLKDKYVYGFVGRLESVKNPDFLLDVFHEIVKKQGEACRLLFVGDGSMREKLQQRAQERKLSDKVIFVGDTKNPAQYYQAMDHMVLPSQSEGLSMVAIEAQAAGLPFTCSAGRFPNTIALTSLVNFVALEDGPQAWADACIAHGRRFAGDDRENWNQTVFESGFETEKAAERLRQVLTR